MKYQNFKRTLAAILAAALTVGSTAIVASAQEESTPTIEYTLAGGSSDGSGGGDYVVDIDAVGGLINIGAITIEYDADLYSGVTFTPAKNIANADAFWIVNNDTAGLFTFAFASDDGSYEELASLFAEDNLSGTIAYIDATNPVNIGTLTFTFAEGKTYATTFTTKKANENKITATAENILHAVNGYDTSKHSAKTTITDTLVFTAADFTVENTEVEYKANTAKAPSVESDVAAFTLALGDDNAKEVIDAGTYAIKVINVAGEGYYDADVIDLGVNFVINRGKATIEAPVAEPATDVYVDGGFDPQEIELSSGDWEVTDTEMLAAGEYKINVEFIGTLDKNIDYTAGEGVTFAEGTYTAKVAFEVTKAEGKVPTLANPASVTYKADVEQTVAGYNVDLSEGWEFVDANTALVIGENKDIAVKFVPANVANYEYDGYNETLGYVPGTVTVTLNKAIGTAPTLPVVKETAIRLNEVGAKIAVAEFVDEGVWSTDVTELAVGKHTVKYTFKPDNQDVYDYTNLENWNAGTEQFEYSVELEVQKPYLASGLVPPASPAAKTFDENEFLAGYTYGDFILSGDWVYDAPDTVIESAGVYENIKVKYPIPADYDVNPADGYTVENGYVISTVTITLNKNNISDTNIGFAQTSVYTGSAIELDAANIKVTGLTGVSAANVTLTAVEGTNVGTYDVYATVAATANYNEKESFKVGTLTITPADVTAKMFTLEYEADEYDGTAKTPKVTAADGVAIPAVKYYNANGDEVAEPTVVGTYTVKVTAEAYGNYNAYADLVVGTFKITNKIVTINKPADPAAVDYVDGGFDVSTLTFTDWVVTDTAKVGAGTHTVNIQYTGTLDTANNEYVAGTGVTKTENVFTATVSLTVNKVAGTVTAPEATQTVTFNAEKSDKKVTTYVDSFGDGWTVVDAEQTLTYGKNTVTVKHDADTDNKTWDGYEIGVGYITKNVEVVFNKAVIDTTAPPVLKEGTNNKVFVEGGYAYSAFEIATADWAYVAPSDRITTAGTVTAKVQYKIGDDYTVAENSGWTVVDGYIVSEVALTVVKAGLPADAAVAAKVETVYDGSEKTVEVTAKDGYTGLGTFTVAYEGNKNAGTYDVTVTFADGTNYKGGEISLADYLVIAKADVKESDITVSGTSYVYDGTAKKPTATVANAEIGAPVVTIAEAINAGKYTFTVSGEEADNYNEYTFEYVDGMEITKATLTAVNFVIDENDFTFDNTAKKATVSAQNVAGSIGTITVTYKQGETTVAEPTNAGTYNVYVTVADSTNYSALGETFVGAYEIKKAALPEGKIKFAQSTVYTGAVVALDKEYITIDDSLIGVTKDDITLSIVDGAEAKDAGEYNVVANIADTANFTANGAYAVGKLTITQAEVTKDMFTVTNNSYEYDGNAKTATVTANDGVGAPTVTYAPAEVKNAGDYTIIVSGDATKNYKAYTNIELDAKLTITRKSVIINKPANLEAVDYVAGGVVASGLTFPENWIYADAADKKLDAGENQTIAVKYNATLDTANYNYTAGDDVTGNAEDGFTSTVTVTVNKIPGVIPALTKTYEATFKADYADKKVGDYVTIAENVWTLVNADAVLEYKDNNTFVVETVVDTKNYTYEADGITVGDGKLTAEITVKFNKAQGTVPALTNVYEVTYDATKADKKVATYITIEDAAWKLADAEAVLEYKADNKFAVEYATNTVDYDYPATEGVTVGEGKLTAEITVNFKKASLPEDAYSVAKVEVEYNGDDQDVVVTANDKYVGLGVASVVYHEGRTDAGTYDVKVIVAEGDNYLGTDENGIIFEDVLVITKQILENISAPTFNVTEAIVGDKFSGDAGEGFAFDKEYVIIEGDNELKVTKTIAGDYAKNYDYSVAAAKVGLVLTIDSETGNVTLSKTFTVVGKLATGTLTLVANTSSEQDDTDFTPNDVTITILPEGGEAYTLTADQFTEAGSKITVSNLTLTAGTYTITVKKQRYLAYTVKVAIAGGATVSEEIRLLGGDIVGGAVGSEVLGDGVIDIDDFVIAIRAFDVNTSPEVKNAADINEDDTPNVTDLAYIKANFNKTTATDCTIDRTAAN